MKPGSKPHVALILLDDWSWEWQHDYTDAAGGQKHPLCEYNGTTAGGVADAIRISKELLAKYKAPKEDGVV